MYCKILKGKILNSELIPKNYNIQDVSFKIVKLLFLFHGSGNAVMLKII